MSTNRLKVMTAPTLLTTRTPTCPLWNVDFEARTHGQYDTMISPAITPSRARSWHRFRKRTGTPLIVLSGVMTYVSKIAGLWRNFHSEDRPAPANGERERLREWRVFPRKVRFTTSTSHTPVPSCGTQLSVPISFSKTARFVVL